MTEQLTKEEVDRLTAETARSFDASPVPRTEAETPTGEVLAPKRNGGRKRLILLALLVIVGGGAAYKGYDWYTRTRFLVSTDDAYVKADTAVIAAKVSGYISFVSVIDNQPVKAGDLLVKIDDGDYKLAVDAAQRKVQTQDSTIERIAAQVRAQGPVIDQARADRDRTAATVVSARAAIGGATATLAVLEAQKGEAESTRAELQTALERAVRDLSFTEVRAAFDGVIGNKAVQPGQYVQTGTRLLALVPLDSAYVEANFKETQLGALKPGQRAAIWVDAYSDKQIDGIVESFAPASGSQFSLLPPENATGNFTKIVQRVPVRIKVPPEIARAGILRPGLSVIVEVRTRDDE